MGLLRTFSVTARQSVRNVILTAKFDTQFVPAVILVHKDLTRSGYSSLVTVHGIGPIPGAKNAKYRIRPVRDVIQYLLGQK